MSGPTVGYCCSKTGKRFIGFLFWHVDQNGARTGGPALIHVKRMEPAWAHRSPRSVERPSPPGPVCLQRLRSVSTALLGGALRERLRYTELHYQAGRCACRMAPRSCPPAIVTTSAHGSVRAPPIIEAYQPQLRRSAGICKSNCAKPSAFWQKPGVL